MYPGNTKKKWQFIQIQHQIALNIQRANVLNGTTLLKTRITRVTGNYNCRPKNDTCTEGTRDQVPTNYFGKILEEWEEEKYLKKGGDCGGEGGKGTTATCLSFFFFFFFTFCQGTGQNAHGQRSLTNRLPL